MTRGHFQLFGNVNDLCKNKTTKQKINLLIPWFQLIINHFTEIYMYVFDNISKGYKITTSVRVTINGLELQFLFEAN